jgi:hypothetical protein
VCVLCDENEFATPENRGASVRIDASLRCLAAAEVSMWPSLIETVAPVDRSRDDGRERIGDLSNQ